MCEQSQRFTHISDFEFIHVQSHTITDKNYRLGLGAVPVLFPELRLLALSDIPAGASNFRL